MNKSEAQVLDFEKICRLCLLEKRSMSSIFSKKKSDKKVPLPVRIMSCASLELYEGDGLPSSICSKCLLSVNQSYAFREQCEQADTTLRQYAQRLNEANEESSLNIPFFNQLEVEVEDEINEFENGSGKFGQIAETMKERREDDRGSEIVVCENEICNVLPDEEPKRVSQENEVKVKRVRSPGFKAKNFNLVPGTMNDRVESERNCHGLGRPTIGFCDYSSKNCNDSAIPEKTVLKERDREKKRLMKVKKSRRDTCEEGESLLKEKKGLTTAQFYLEYAGEMEDKLSDQIYFKRDTVYCKVCKIFIGRPYFYNHVKYVHKNIRNHLCQECGYRAHTYHILSLHMEAKHSGIVLRCEKCPMSFNCRKQLKLHLNKHHSGKSMERKQVCQYCGKMFATCGYLKNHIRVHTQETPYGCRFCKRKFKSKWAWKTHEHLHTGVKPYKCTYCAKAFTQNCVRKNHEYRIHGNEAFNPKNRVPKEGNRREKRARFSLPLPQNSTEVEKNVVQLVTFNGNYQT